METNNTTTKYVPMRIPVPEGSFVIQSDGHKTPLLAIVQYLPVLDENMVDDDEAFAGFVSACDRKTIYVSAGMLFLANEIDAAFTRDGESLSGDE